MVVLKFQASTKSYYVYNAQVHKGLLPIYLPKLHTKCEFKRVVT